ncbi:MAG TPA: extracellular solute-binding protein [Gemmatimonadales bacterium]|jgi:iron(III) transport system substrate-binding protein|nr:extracellular solute-binding protein [Gemmatimonadales bacterium]
MSPKHRVRLVAAALLVTACSRDPRTPLVIYSPHGRDLLTLLERHFEQLYPDVDVRWLDMGSQEVYDRLRSERANPQADVWFGGPATIFARGATDSLLEPFAPSWASAIDPHGRGPGDAYAAVYETPAVIVYAVQAVSAAAAPHDWDDLLLPRWRGQVLIRDPLASGTMRAVWGMVVERGLAQTGDTAAGFAWLRRLDAQTKEYVLNGPLLDQKIVRQEGLVTIWDLPDILLSQRDGLALGYVFPTSGTPVIEDAIGVVRHARHGAQARAWVEYVGSMQAQLLAAREAFRLPARRDVPIDSLPAWARAVRRDMKVAPVDWDLLARREAEWMRYWDQTVRGRGAAR